MHFLFQGHEAGTPGYITRINLDADVAHRVTVLATQDSAGHALRRSTARPWDPWAKRLLLTTENVNTPTYAATPAFPSTDVHRVRLAIVTGQALWEWRMNVARGSSAGPSCRSSRSPRLASRETRQ